jgi:hypothetical protein
MEHPLELSDESPPQQEGNRAGGKQWPTPLYGLGWNISLDQINLLIKSELQPDLELYNAGENPGLKSLYFYVTDAIAETWIANGYEAKHKGWLVVSLLRKQPS